MCAKYYENLTMLSRVITKNVGDVFLRHTVEWMVGYIRVDCGMRYAVIVIVSLGYS